MSQKQRGGVSQTYLPFSPVVIGVFRPSPARQIRASGGGLDGSDPPFLTAGAVSRWGGCDTPRHARCHTPPAFGGVAPVVFILAGRLPGPHAGWTMTTRTTTRTRRTNRLTAARFPAGNRADLRPRHGANWNRSPLPRWSARRSRSNGPAGRLFRPVREQAGTVPRTAAHGTGPSQYERLTHLVD